MAEYLLPVALGLAGFALVGAIHRALHPKERP